MEYHWGYIPISDVYFIEDGYTTSTSTTHTGSILDEDDMQNSSKDTIIDYYVSLDDDGSLAV